MTPSKTNDPVLTDADVLFVLELARQAGKLASKMREGVGIEEKTGPHDRVTEADLELSRLISEALTDKFPDDMIISEEDQTRPTELSSHRVWVVDPIDGTDNYISNDGQWSVMIGLVVDQKPVFGCVYAGAHDIMYYGGPGHGTWKLQDRTVQSEYKNISALASDGQRRLMMGFRDAKTHPWVIEMPSVHFVKSGSVGLKVAKILEGEADMFVHLSGKLKVWDTAAPVAYAVSAGLEVGQLEADGLPFELPKIQHECSVIIGRPGSLEWCRANLLKPS